MKRCLAEIGLLLFAYSCSVSAQDAAMFRGNLQHTGVYNAAGAPKFSALKWKFHKADVGTRLGFQWDREPQTYGFLRRSAAIESP